MIRCQVLIQPVGNNLTKPLEGLNCLYIFGLSGNKRLNKISAPWRDDAATRRVLADNEKVRRFFWTNFSAKSWRRDRNIIARGEATTLSSGVCFIVTNIPSSKAKHLYEKIYCALGRMENLIKEHKLFFAIRPDLMPSLGSDPVLSVPAHRRLLAHASAEKRCSEEIPVGRSLFRNDLQHLHQNRRPCRTDEDTDPRIIPLRDAKHRRHQHDARKDRRTGTVGGAATEPL